MASRKHVEDFLFLSRVLERRMGRFSSSAGDSGCSSSDSTTLASPFCLESARRWQIPISKSINTQDKVFGVARRVCLDHTRKQKTRVWQMARSYTHKFRYRKHFSGVFGAPHVPTGEGPPLTRCVAAQG